MIGTARAVFTIVPTLFETLLGRGIVDVLI
jgi:hypothetical protein